MKSTRWAPILLAVVGGSGCSDWREGVQPELSMEDPIQVALDPMDPFPLPDFPEYSALPRARYQVTAWAVATDFSMTDPFAEVVPYDVGLIWGPAVEFLPDLTFYLNNRLLVLRWREKAVQPWQLLRPYFSNNHLLPGSLSVEESIQQIRPGDLVSLEGYLVELTGPPGMFRTSLSRTDKGNSCETIFVQKVTVQRPRM